jgi:DNA-directed RNA polymerase specialized sigma24 family protein
VRVRRDLAEQVGLVARARRAALLRANRHRLRPEDLEECFSQAICELLVAVRAGRRFAGRAHIANALEQRFQSRIRDRRRALSGRSPLQAALEDAIPLGGQGDCEVELRDARAEVHQLVAWRLELERLLDVAGGLSADQRLVLASQVVGVGRAEFCLRFDWSFEKYRKVAQRGRRRLRAFLDAEPRASSARQQPARPISTPLRSGGVPRGGSASE